jgi:hypothetical protein
MLFIFSVFRNFSAVLLAVITQNKELHKFVTQSQSNHLPKRQTCTDMVSARSDSKTVFYMSHKDSSIDARVSHTFPNDPLQLKITNLELILSTKN